MPYSISEVAKIMGVPASTLRYYDSEGLLPHVRRENDRRIFENKDFRWLRILSCMKRIDMPINKIKEYVDLAKQGDSTLQARYALILKQKRKVEQEIAELQKCYAEFSYKEWYYKTALEQGTEEGIIDPYALHPTMEVDRIPDKPQDNKKGE